MTRARLVLVHLDRVEKLADRMAAGHRQASPANAARKKRARRR